MKQRNINEFYQVNPRYIDELYFLQVELLKLQKHIAEKKMRLAIFFEGRDTAGKGAAIFRLTQFLNPREYRIVALGKPTKKEKGQWYFQRYLKQFPNAGEIVFFDRSWYNRAVVEPVMGFCTESQYQQFMDQVPLIEKMLVEDGVVIIKFWFWIDRDQQNYRIQERLESPLKHWKVSPVDLAAQSTWEDFTKYKKIMFKDTSTDASPWLNIKSPVREESRFQAMRYILSQFDYKDRSESLPAPDGKQLKRV